MTATTDTPAVPPVFTEDMRSYYAEVESFQSNAARSATRKLRLSLAGNAAQFVIVCGLTAGIVLALPMIRLQLVFLWVKPDGTVEAAVTPQGLPPSLNHTAQIATASEYVRLYEGYSKVESEYNWNTISALSDKSVRDQYQADHDPKNKQAPVNVLGDKTVIHVEILSASPACADCTNRYNVRFVRIVKQVGMPEQRSNWVATVEWTTEFAEQIPYRQRMTFNAPGLTVTGYPGAQQEGAP